MLPLCSKAFKEINSLISKLQFQCLVSMQFEYRKIYTNIKTSKPLDSITTFSYNSFNEIILREKTVLLIIFISSKSQNNSYNLFYHGSTVSLKYFNLNYLACSITQSPYNKLSMLITVCGH